MTAGPTNDSQACELHLPFSNQAPFKLCCDATFGKQQFLFIDQLDRICSLMQSVQKKTVRHVRTMLPFE
jgi:hypothetical protein